MHAPLERAPKPEIEIAIIGAGFAGLGMAMQLRRAGREDFVILEQADEVGGTWRDNTYPGCACDVPAHLYSFSFEQNPDWSHLYAPQQEIQDYILGLVEKYELRPRIRFNTRVSGLRWDDAAALWHLQFEGGGHMTAKTVVAGLGPLNKPDFPEIPGLERFEGASFHSSWWDHSVSLKGKRVAAIGTGASAIQFVPAIAPEVASLHLFQRTPPWIMPHADKPVSGFTKWMFRNFPFIRNLFRASLYWQMEAAAIGFTMNPWFLKKAQRFALRHIEKQVADPELRRKVTPDYVMGCKRILMSNDWYPALQRDNVHLETEGIAEVRAKSLVTGDGREYPVDVIIHGTGFRATEIATDVEITGRNGRSLNEEWRQAPEAYLGITVSGYPNLFFLVGPNTGLGHNSILYMIEAQVAYVMDCLHTMDRKKLRAIDVKPKVQRRFNERLQKRMGSTVWVSGCKSWYQTEDGRIPTLWPGFTFTYR
ncbi:MAG: flavin-containing monooxygenase, partial [Alphaproteobacteria bacterium]